MLVFTRQEVLNTKSSRAILVPDVGNSKCHELKLYDVAPHCRQVCGRWLVYVSREF